MNKKHLLFRCDSNLTIGSGHFTRSFALAEEFITKGWEITFLGDLVQPKWINYLKKSLKNIRFITLKQFEKEKNTYEAVFFDTYIMDINQYEKIIKKCEYIIWIVDNVTPLYQADLYISCLPIQNLYKFKDVSNYLFGTEYAQIRKSILNGKKIKQKFNKRTNLSVAIFSGGVSKFDIIFRLATQLIDAFECCEFNIYGNFSKKSQNRIKTDKLNFKKINADFFEDIYKYDLIISSASVMIWELLYLEVPLAVYGIYENQKEIYNYLTQNYFVPGIGFSENFNSFKINVDELQKTLMQIRVNEISKINLKIDGEGCKRIVEHTSQILLHKSK